MAVFFAGTSLIAVIAAVYLWVQLRAGNREIAELRQQVQQLQVAQGMGAALVPVTADAGGVQSMPASAVAPVAMAAATVAAPPVAQPMGLAMDCDAQRTQMRALLARSNASMVTELKLSPDEAERILDIQAAQAALMPACARPDSGAEPLEAQLQAVLGPVRYEQWQEYNTAVSTRQNIATLRNQLATASAPLDAEQEKQLMATIMEENRRTRAISGTATPPTEPHARLAYEEQALRLTEDRFERVVTAAQAYLRPSQIAQLQGNMTRQISAMQANVARIRASVEAGKGIPQAEPVTIMMLPALAP